MCTVAFFSPNVALYSSLRAEVFWSYLIGYSGQNTSVVVLKLLHLDYQSSYLIMPQVLKERLGLSKLIF